MAGTVAQQFAFRAATSDDAAFAADVMTAVTPESPWDPVSLRYWWSQPDEFVEIVRFIVLRGERPIGFTQIDHARWDVQPERYASIRGELMPTDRTRDALSALLAPMEERAIADGARILRVSANDDDALRSGAILGRGYRKDRHQRRWELDLVANRERLLAMTTESRARMRQEGVRLMTLAEDTDPDVITKVWQLSEEAGDDVPTTVPRTVRENVVDEMHGAKIVDAYRWLEADATDRVRDWTDQQNARTRAVLDALPQRAAFARRLRELLSVGLLSTPRPIAGRIFH